MFNNLFRRYMEQLDGQSSSGGANTTTPDAAPGAAPDAGTVPDPAGAPDNAAPENKVDESKPGDKPDETKPKDEPQGAPEKYDLKLADGTALHPDVQTQFEATARELNMSQESAQKLVEAMAPKIAATQAAAMEAMQTEWTTAAKADKEFGGPQFDANLAVAKTALARFGSPELTTFLNESGLGNHPEMIRMMYKAGKAISEDKHVPGRQAAAPQRDMAKSLYPNSK